MKFSGLRALIIVVVVVPIAAFAADMGALLGMLLACLGWGTSALDVGPAAGAPFGLAVLVGCFVWIVKSKTPDKPPVDGASFWKPGRKKP